MACQKVYNKVGMMHESKAPSLHLFHTIQLDSAWESSYKMYHKLPWDEAKTMPCIFTTLMYLQWHSCLMPLVQPRP